MKIEIANSFDSLSHFWNTLLSNSHINNPHSTYEWLSTWWKYFGKDRELFILTAKENNKIIGIVPLMIKRRKIKGILSLREISFIGEGLSDFADFIIADGLNRSVIEEIFKLLISSQKRQKWDEIALRNVPETSKYLAISERICKAYNLIYSIEKQTPCYYIDLTKFINFEDYYKKSISGKTRHSLKGTLNKLSRNKIESNFLQIGSDKLIKYFAKFVEMYNTRQTALGRTTSFKDEQELRFLKEVLPTMLKKELCIVSITAFNGEIAAYSIDFISQDTFYHWNVSFDMKYSQFSPGKIHQLNLIKYAFEQKLREFNFMRGASEYKEHFTKDFRWNYRINIFNTLTRYSRFINKWRHSYKAACRSLKSK